MTSLQLGLIIGGVVLVVGVLIFNWLQIRRARQRLAAAAAPRRDAVAAPGARGDDRQEPSLAPQRADGDTPRPIPSRPVVPENPARAADDAAGSDDDFVPPIDFAPPMPDIPPARDDAGTRVPAASVAESLALSSAGTDRMPQPDPDIECVVTLQPVRPVTAGAIAAGLHARVGKPLRWFGREGPGLPWHPLAANTAGEWRELAACFLLADRAGAATRPLVERFLRFVGEQAAALPAAFVAPDPQAEVARGEALDRICADHDVQIGLTVLKTGPNPIAGTRLRGVAEAAGFRLMDSGRFEWIQEDSGSVLYTLQNYRPEPFTADSLRLNSTPGAVFVLDVPRVADPVRVFDQMKLAAKRMTQTLDAVLVDDNKRPLTDASLSAIRQQVQATAAALKEVRIDPGSPRAMALFGG